MLDTVETLYKKILQILNNSRVKNIYNDLNKLSIDIILSVINKDYTYFVLNRCKNLDKNLIPQIYVIAEKIKQGVPFAYATQKAYFYNYDFFVNENVLIPRFDTEIMVDAVIKSLKKDGENNILDLGCGSGCIGLTLLKEVQKSKAVFVDISMEALKVVQINANKLNVAEKTMIIQSDWVKAIKVKNAFDVIVVNPPYISKNDTDIKWNVKQYEPHLALFADFDGFYNYFKIFRKIKYYMDENTCLFIEIGWKQYDKIIKIAQKYSLVLKHVHKDLQGISRILEFVKK